MAVERRQLILGGAAMVVVVLAVTVLWPASRPTTQPAPAAQTTSTRANTARPGDDAQPAGPVAPVKLESLAEKREQPGEERRNPFRFQPKPVPAPPKPVVTAPSPDVESARPEPPPGPPPAPPIPLKLIGVLERANGVKWAVLTDGKNALMYGKDGDIVDGRYQIVKIGTESVEMTYADGRGRTVIRLTGQ
jgi:hypothetical protein